MSINTETDQQQQATSIDPFSYWKMSWKLLHCPKCNSRKICEIKEAAAAPMIFWWVKHMYCTNCFSCWSICIQCSNVRNPFILRGSRKGTIRAGITVTHWWYIKWSILVLTISGQRSDLNKQVYQLELQAIHKTEWHFHSLIRKVDISLRRNTQHGLGTAYPVANTQFKLDLVASNLHKDYGFATS